MKSFLTTYRKLQNTIHQIHEGFNALNHVEKEQIISQLKNEIDICICELQSDLHLAHKQDIYSIIEELK